MWSETEEWYLREGGTVSGPFTLRQLSARQRSGELNWHHEVSQDGLMWVSVTSLPQVDDEGPDLKPDVRPAGRGGPWLGAGVVGVVGVLAVLGLVWFAQSSGESSPDEGAAILAVLEADEEASNATVRAVSPQDAPSVYARAITQYLARMHQVDTSECPPEFRVAFKHHLQAWEELHDAVAQLPEDIWQGLFVGLINGFLRKEPDGGLTRMGDEVDRATKMVRHSYQEVEKIAARHGVALP